MKPPVSDKYSTISVLCATRVAPTIDRYLLLTNSVVAALFITHLSYVKCLLLVKDGGGEVSVPITVKTRWCMNAFTIPIKKLIEILQSILITFIERARAHDNASTPSRKGVRNAYLRFEARKFLSRPVLSVSATKKARN